MMKLTIAILSCGLICLFHSKSIVVAKSHLTTFLSGPSKQKTRFSSTTTSTRSPGTTIALPLKKICIAPRIEVPLSLLHSNNQNEDKAENTNNRETNNAEEIQLTLSEKVDQFLDTQFFDPEAYTVSNEVSDGTDDSTQTKNGVVSWFANLVQNDYELAETLYAGTFLVIMVIISQELVRWSLYGDNYVPFTPGGRSGGGLW